MLKKQKLLFFPLTLSLSFALFVFFSKKNTEYFQLLNELSQIIPEEFWGFWTLTGNAGSVLVLLAFLLWKQPRRFFFLLLGGIVLSLVVRLLKISFDVARPAFILEKDSINIIGETLHFFSFPSGHTASAFFFCGIIAIHFKNRFLSTLSIIAAFIMGFARIAVGAHFPLDVLIGSVLGWGAAFLFAYVAQKSTIKIHNYGIVTGICGLIIFFQCFFILNGTFYTLPGYFYFRLFLFFQGTIFISLFFYRWIQEQKTPSYQVLSFLIIGLSTGIRLFLSFQADLTVDEAHYALYGKFLDYSYFDHPPLIGYLNAGVLFFGATDELLRILPNILHLITALLLWKICLGKNHNQTAALFGVILFEGSSFSLLLGIALIPDSLLILWALLLAYFINQLVQLEKKSIWLVIGLLFGLAGLTKYSAILFIFMCLPLLKKRHLLLNGYFLLGGIIAILCITPVIFWNIQHDWISLNYQFNHGFIGETEHWKIFAFLLIYCLSYHPLIIKNLLLAPLYIWRKKLTKTEFIYLLGSAPLFWITLINSGTKQSLPHWIMPAIVLMVPMTAHQMAHLWQKKKKTLIFITSFFPIPILALLIIMSSGKDYHWPSSVIHPHSDIYGWKEMAEKIDTTEPGTTVFLPNWSLLSRFGWYGKSLNVKALSSKVTQFHFWYGGITKGDSGKLVIPLKYKKNEAEYLNAFEKCHDKETFEFKSINATINAFDTYQCYSFRGN